MSLKLVIIFSASNNRLPFRSAYFYVAAKSKASALQKQLLKCSKPRNIQDSMALCFCDYFRSTYNSTLKRISLNIIL